ncbi:MAG: hypothetical protein E7239_10925 [Sarcina sp.]|nr:hypothetical protein [Sarcina sp.]
MSARNLLRAMWIASVFFLLAGLTASCGFKTGSGSPLSDSAQETAIEAGPGLSVVLYGNQSESDYEILQDTLRHAFSGKDYSLEKQQDNILLQLHKDFISKDQLQTFLEYFIVEPGRWNLTCTAPDDAATPLHTVAECTPETCTDVSVGPALQEADAGSADRDIPFLDFEEDHAGSMRLRFTDPVAGKLQDTIRSGAPVYLCRNLVYEDYKTDSIFREGWELRPDRDAPDTFYIDYSASNILYGNEKLFQYLMTHEALSAPYNYFIVSEVSWEQSGGNAYCGEMQHTVSEIAAPYCQIYGSSWKTLFPEKRETLDLQLKEKLDRLQTPYAFGHTADGDVCIRMQSGRLSESTIALLLDDNVLSLSIPGVDDSVQLDYSNIQYTAEPPSITVSLSSDLSKRLQEALTAEQTEDGQDAQGTPYVYLCAGKPLAVCSPVLPLANNKLTFTETIFPDFSSESGDYSWLAELLSEKRRDQQSSSQYSLDHYFCYDSVGYSWDDPSSFQMKEKELISIGEIEQNIRKLVPDAEVTLSEDNHTITVRMHLQADDELVKKIFEMTPEILKAASIENQYYSTLRILPCEPSGDELAWIYIERDMRDALDSQDTAAWAPVPFHFSGWFYNGRFDQYKEEILSRMETDNFFSSMILDDRYDGWNLRSGYKDFNESGSSSVDREP